MAETKGKNYRFSEEGKAAFKDFMDKGGYKTQAQAFDHIMQIVEMDQVKEVVPERKTEIEAFEKAVKDIMDFYLMSVELGKSAEERAKENFKSLLESKDKTITDLQGKVEVYKAEKDEAESTALTASNTLAQAIKDAETAKEQAEMSKKLLEEKEKTVATLAEKANAYDGLLEENINLKSELKDIKSDVDRQLSDAKKDTELAVAKAVAEKEKECMQRMMELEKENMKLLTKLEMLEK